jgi:hypothetical protein
MYCMSIFIVGIKKQAGAKDTFMKRKCTLF